MLSKIQAINLRLKVIEMKRISVLLLLIVLVAGSVWSQNKVLSLDGDGDYVEIPYDPKFKIVEQITLECWVRVGDDTSGVDRIIAKHWHQHTEPWLIFGLVRVGHTNKLGFQFTIDPNISKIVESPIGVFQKSVWVHVAAVYDGSNIFLYANGLEIYKEEFAGGRIASNNKNIIIGANNLEEQMREDLNALVDEARIWNLAKTEAEIQASMNSTLTGKEKGLVGYWNFDDGTAKDLTENYNDGEFKGDAKTVETPLSGVFIFDLGLRSILEIVLGKNEGSPITKEDLIGIKELDAVDRGITDISVLKNAISLTKLDLEGNRLTDISALIENTGISGTINLTNNPLNNTALSTHIPELEARGITVEYDMPEDVVLFKDANLEQAIRNALGIPTELVQKEDLEQLEELVYEGKEGAKISDLTGIEHCINMSHLNLYNNQITDLRVLESCSNLVELYINENQISDVTPLAGLIQLERLSLRENQISDISPLSNLIKLKYLTLQRNNISDVSPLANLVQLEDLQIYYMNNVDITDISSLESLTKLKNLEFTGNAISDISVLSNFKELEVLWAQQNVISDISSLSELTKLRRLIIYDCRISDISPLRNLTLLKDRIDLSNNRITDITPLVENTGISGEINLKNNPLNNTALSTHIPALEARGIKIEYDMPEGVVLFKDANLEKAIRDALGIPTELLKKENLEQLEKLSYAGKEGAQISDLTGLDHCISLVSIYFYGNQISDLMPISNLTELTSINLVSNQVSDISKLAKISKLSDLSIQDNQISDISALAELTNLKRLWLSGNKITDISVLENLIHLQATHLGGNKITDISVLASLTNIDYLIIHTNQISDLSPLKNLTNISALHAYENQITDISVLASMSKLRELYLYSNNITDLTPIVENTGISGRIKLQKNPLNNTALSTHIPALIERGITVEHDDIPSDIVTFKDANLEKAIRDALGIPTELLKKKDLEQLTKLEYQGKEEAKISELTGIESATNLEILSLNQNKISNLEPIQNLSSLTQIRLEGNAVTNISPLKNLNLLETLDLDGNGITDTSFLSNLTLLKSLELYVTPIGDSNFLKDLIQLESLQISSTGIQDLSFLERMSQLKFLWVEGNPLYNSTLHRYIPNLQKAGVSVSFSTPEGNFLPFNSVKIEKVVRTTLNIPTGLLTDKNTLTLTELNLEDSNIVDLDMDALQSLPNLKALNLTKNPLSVHAILIQIPELESAGITIDLGTSTAVKVELAAEQVSIPASLSASTNITITATDVDGHKIKRETITLSADHGKIQTPAINNGDGTYSTTYSAFDTPGQVTISAVTSNGQFSTINVQLTEVLVSTDKSSLKIQPASPKTGDQVAINITLRNQNELTLSGQPVSIIVEPMEGVVINQPSDLTDTEGQMTAYFTSSQPGLKVVKVHSGEVILDTSLAAIFEVAIQPTWSASLQITSTDVELDPQIIQFGMADQASDDFDHGLDTVAPPAPQSPIKLDAYLSNADDLFSRLLADYRSNSQVAEYNLHIRADQTDFTLSWDLSQLPNELSSLRLKQISPQSNRIIELTNQESATFTAENETYYQFELRLGRKATLHLAPGWNLISLPGYPYEKEPQALIGDSQTAMLPIFSWNPTGSSYQQVTEIKFGEGYWVLSLNPEGETLDVPLIPAPSYKRPLAKGWNMIGSVSAEADFRNPKENPAGSIVAGTLYSWNPKSYKYQGEQKIESNKGYWVLALEDCQLTIGGEVNVPTAPQVLAGPEVLLVVNLSSGDWNQQLELGTDPSSRDSLDPMDRPIPPSGPIEVEHQTYLVGKPYRLRRDIRSASEQEISWQIRLSSPDPVQLSLDSQKIPQGKELIIIDSQIERILTAGMEIDLDSGDRQLTVSLRSLPKETQVWQNYPNPFNPETWIPYQLNQESEVSLSIYGSDGQLVRQIDLGLQVAGNYQTSDRAIYWDGRNANGEEVSSGIYFYRLQAGDYSQTRKMVILK